MKIELIVPPRKEMIKQFLDTHEGELFNIEELRKAFGPEFRAHSQNIAGIMGPQRTIYFKGQWRFGSVTSVEKAKRIQEKEANGKN